MGAKRLSLRVIVPVSASERLQFFVRLFHSILKIDIRREDKAQPKAREQS